MNLPTPAFQRNTKLKADIAEHAVITELLKRGFSVLKPVGDRLPYDLAVEMNGRLIRIQVKSAWRQKNAYLVDNRRTKTNRRKMLRAPYTCHDFDFAVLFIEETHTFYVMPVQIFISFKSGISLVEDPTRQRPPRSANYRDAWFLLNEKNSGETKS